jgi:hypothetical protein
MESVTYPTPVVAIADAGIFGNCLMRGHNKGWLVDLGQHGALYLYNAVAMRRTRLMTISLTALVALALTALPDQ